MQILRPYFFYKRGGVEGAAGYHGQNSCEMTGQIHTAYGDTITSDISRQKMFSTDKKLQVSRNFSKFFRNFSKLPSHFQTFEVSYL